MDKRNPILIEKLRNGISIVEKNNHYRWSSMIVTKPTESKWVTLFMNSIAFFIALLSFVKFQIIGELYLSELILVMVFITMFWKHGNKLYAPIPKRIILFGLLWLFSQMVTDILRATPIENLMRGWAAILFFLVDFAALYMLLNNNEKRLNIFIWGIAIGGIIKIIVAPSEYSYVEPWKFGYGPPVILMTILSITWAEKYKIIIPLIGELLLALLGLVSIYFNARSLGGSVILTAMLLFAIRNKMYLHGASHKDFSNNVRLISLSLMASMLILSILTLYQWVGSAGILPEKAQLKYELNKTSSFGVLGIILSGRSEILASLPAVIDSPIIGHGSWAEGYEYRLYLYDIGITFGNDSDVEMLRRSIESRDSIPAHSHLMQAWVWAGLLGAVFWIVILGIILKSLIHSLVNRNILSMITVYICITAGWDLLFSPFGSQSRITWGWKLALIILAYNILQSRVYRIIRTNISSQQT